jgi:hypothetical protein
MGELTIHSASRAVNRLALMAFFPPDEEVRAALVDIVMEMVESQEQLDWLVNRALKLYTKWPGVAELRALYCSRWPPRDGITTYSSIYLDGIPSERAAPPILPILPPGRAVTASRRLDDAVKDLGRRKAMPPGPGKRGQ